MNWMIGVVLVLGVMILVHEWGHFAMARLFKVRVDVFSIGFGPRLFGWKRGDTDYRISALPLGGYVRMAGQDPTEIDSPNRDWRHLKSAAAPETSSEVSDVTRKAAEFRGVDQPLRLSTGAPDELMSKPRWQRALISFAGPAVNLVFPILLLTGLYAIKGEPYPEYFDAPVQVVALQERPAAPQALRLGDKIVAMEGVSNPTWEQADRLIGNAAPGSRVTLEVENADGRRKLSLEVPRDPEQLGRVFGYPPIAPIVDAVSAGDPADRAGVQVGDKIVSVNGQPIQLWGQFVDRVRASGGSPVTIGVERNAGTKQVTVTPRKETTDRDESVYVVGVGVREQFRYRSMPFSQAVSVATSKTGDMIAATVGVVGKLVSGKVSINQLQGPVGISSEAGKAMKRGSVSVIFLMVLISVNLGILNLLPIPILDGGNILLLAIEGGLRRDLSMTFKERYIQVGLVFLLVLFAIVMYHDVLRRLPIHS
jgi:regulator of sigma E protease